jgi:Flp pilus assembly protein TadG
MSAQACRARTALAGTALARIARRFERADSGIAVVEFALILPIMVTMYLGLVSLTMGVNTDRKLTLVSRTIPDLVSRSSATLSNTDLANILGAATAVFAPYKPNGMKIAVASVYVKDTGKTDASGKTIVTASICWSTARTVLSDGSLGTGTLPSGWGRGTTISPVPDGFSKATSTYLVSRVEQQYTPVIGEAVSGKINLVETTPWPVRNVPEVTLQGEAACMGT